MTVRAVASGSILDHHIISQRYFFPRPGQPPKTRDFTMSDGAVLRCLEYRPHPQAKTLVHYHGNGEVVADYMDGYLEAIAELGVNVLMVEYRGYGGSDGEPRLGKMLDDVETVRLACGLDSDEVYVYGRSVGAIFAVEWAAQDPNISGLILESGVADPRQRLVIRLKASELGVSQADFDKVCQVHLDHRGKLENYSGRMLVLHASGDTLVEPSHAHSHMEWAKNAEKRLVLFPRGDHNTVMGANWKTYLSELGEFFK